MKRQNSTPTNSGPRPEVVDALAKVAASNPLPEAKSDKRKPRRDAKGNRRGATPRKFPAFALEEALRVPLCLKQFNAGNPWPPKDVAKAMGLSVKNKKFYYLAASSRDYGLTTGTQVSSEIVLTELGRRLAYPTSPEAEAATVREALFNVGVFKAVYEYYKGGELPEIKYLSSTLETQFGLTPALHDDFRSFYMTSCAYLRKFTGESQAAVRGQSTDRDSKPIIVGEPKTNTALKAFVIMPFSEKTEQFSKGFFDEVLKNLITPAGVEAGFKVETARRDGSDIIQSTIVNELFEADLVVADLTEHNPNVLFELGLRIAFEKPIALIKADGTPPIFDVDAMLRIASYSSSLWKSTLEKDVPTLAAHIRGAWETRDNPQTWLKLLKKS